MCGACGGGPLVSYQPGDVIEHRARDGASCRVGKVEDLDDRWGVAVVWENGERSWFSYNLFCPINFSTGWSMTLADTNRYHTTPDYCLDPPEVGRGWLPAPPAKRRRRMAARQQQEHLQEQVQECVEIYAETKSPLINNEPEDLRADELRDPLASGHTEPLSRRVSR